MMTTKTRPTMGKNAGQHYLARQGFCRRIAAVVGPALGALSSLRKRHCVQMGKPSTRSLSGEAMTGRSADGFPSSPGQL